MKAVSIIRDGRISADNILIEISIQEYLKVGKEILTKNEYQRKPVKGSSTVYSLLRTDLKVGCTFPPIVLAYINNDSTQFDVEKVNNDDYLSKMFIPNNLIILDGLQRTYNLIEVYDSLKAMENEGLLKTYSDNKIRVELFVGINKIGILYRMLTLNTGQTPMPIRHQIEILYSDYIDENDEIKLLKQKDGKSISAIGEYQFKEVIEGFQSYIQRDESGIDRNDILDIIENMEKVSLENGDKDVFYDYIKTYNSFILKINTLTNNWTYKDDANIDGIFGKDILHIFNKASALSAFGAAAGKMVDNKKIDSISDLQSKINEILMGGEIDDVMASFLKTLDGIKKTAKKIGVEQRAYLRIFFNLLLNEDSETFANFKQSITEAFRKYTSLN